MNRTFTLLACLALLLAAPVHAQDKYPSKPVRLKVPFAGGAGC